MALRFQKALLSWYDRERRPLPWRQTRDPYRIFVSEIVLQQTQVSTVIPYYERFLKAFPTVKALANAPQDRLVLFVAKILATGVNRIGISPHSKSSCLPGFLIKISH